MAERSSADLYGRAGRTLGPPRAVEHQLFSQVTGEMQRAADADDFPALASALARNQALWTTLMADLAQDHNALPEALRAQLISVGVFVLRHTGSVLAREATPTVLVDLNLSVMRGLRGRAEAA
ncbi:MAG: flagellar biosynthesis regulator FlaF [Pseudomonadota bacterium]